MANRLRRIDQERVYTQCTPVTPYEMPTDNHGIRTEPYDVERSLERPNLARRACYEQFNNAQSAPNRNIDFSAVQKESYDETPMSSVSHENTTIPTISSLEITHTNKDGSKSTLYKQSLTLPKDSCIYTSHNLVSSILGGYDIKNKGMPKHMLRDVGKQKKPYHCESVKDVTMVIVQKLSTQTTRKELIEYLMKKLTDGAHFFKERHAEHLKACNHNPCGLARDMCLADYAVVSYHLMLENNDKEEEMRKLRQDLKAHRDLGCQMIKEQGLTHCWRYFKALLVYSQYTPYSKIPTCICQREPILKSAADECNMLWKIRDCDEDSRSESSYKSLRTGSAFSDTASYKSFASDGSGMSNGTATRKSPKSPSPLKRSFSQADIDSATDLRQRSQPSSSNDSVMPLENLQFEVARALVSLLMRHKTSRGADGITEQFSKDFRQNIKALQPILQQHAGSKQELQQYILEQFRLHQDGLSKR